MKILFGHDCVILFIIMTLLCCFTLFFKRKLYDGFLLITAAPAGD